MCVYNYASEQFRRATYVYFKLHFQLYYGY